MKREHYVCVVVFLRLLTPFAEVTLHPRYCCPQHSLLQKVEWLFPRHVFQNPKQHVRYFGSKIQLSFYDTPWNFVYSHEHFVARDQGLMC